MTPVFTMVLILAIVISVSLVISILYNLHRHKKMEATRTGITENPQRVSPSIIILNGDRQTLITGRVKYNTIYFITITGSLTLKK